MTDMTERLERGRAQLLEAMSAVSEDRTCTGWSADWARTLHAEGGIWETLGRAVGWPTGNYDAWVWVSWDEAARLYGHAASSAGRAPAADRAAVLLEAAEALHAKGKDVCDEDSGECCWFDAVAELRRLAGEAQQDEGAQPDVQVWPLQRVLTEVRCGSEDWAWEEEWADLDQHHAARLAWLETEIRENGITAPIVIGNDGRLWDGHHRLRIAVRLGIGYVPVEITPAREAQQDPTQDGTEACGRCGHGPAAHNVSGCIECPGGWRADHRFAPTAVAQPGQPDTDGETSHTGEGA